jgi:hypothetical protein
MANKRMNELTNLKIDMLFEKFGVESGITMEDGVIHIEVIKLKPHQQNELIYGQNEDVTDIKEQITTFGRIIESLKIKEDYTIMSGHRRWKAAMELGMPTVPCEFVRFDSPEEELAALVLYNYKRIKTNEQRTREGIALYETLSIEAVKRRLANLKQGTTDMDAVSTSEEDDENQELDGTNDDKQEIGFTRDIVARTVGIKTGRTFDRMRDVLGKVDELRRDGNTEDSDLLIAVLNRVPSAARELMDVPFENLTTEDRENIKTGKVAPRKFIPKNEPEKPFKRKSSYDKVLTEVDTMKHTIRTLNKSVTRIKNEDEQRITYNSISSIIDNLKNLRCNLLYQHGPYYELIESMEVFNAIVPNMDINIVDKEYLINCKDQIDKLQQLLPVIENALEMKNE